MTQLLEQAVATLNTLPEREQDGIAHLILEELADNQRWDASFASTQDALARVAQKVRADIASRETRTTAAFTHSSAVGREERPGT